MNSNFDYSTFKAQNELHTVFRAFVSNLRESRNVNNDRNFPDGPAGQPRAFEALLQNLKIDTPQANVPQFTFECNGVTLANVEAHCIEEELNFMEFTQNRGNKIYYNRTYDRTRPVWIELSRPEASDTYQELSELIFLDKANTIIDWRCSLTNLKRLGQDRRYTTIMMASALLKIINRYLPEQTILLKDKTADEMAQFLLKLDSHVDKLSYFRSQLFTFQRHVAEDLDSVMARFTNLVDKIYPANNAETVNQRENVLKTAVLSFVPDAIAVPLLNEIKQKSEICKPMTFTNILETAIAAEQYGQIKNVEVLLFGRVIGNSTVSSHIQFNSIQTFVPDPCKRITNLKEAYQDNDRNPTYNTFPWQPVLNQAPQGAEGPRQLYVAQGAKGPRQLYLAQDARAPGQLYVALDARGPGQLYVAQDARGPGQLYVAQYVRDSSQQPVETSVSRINLITKD